MLPRFMLGTDAEECFGQIVTTLRNVPGLSTQASVVPESEVAATHPKKFVEQYLMGEMRRELSFRARTAYF